jgi:cytochrome c oxidase assembly protein subunit 15
VRFARFVWAVLVYDVLVVLWGAYVRATFSGDGCGRHWPLCNGELVPHAEQTKTIVEFSHRVSSGLTLVLAIVLFVWARRAFAKGSAVRLGATLGLAFTLSEAIIGAGLVLLRLVAHDVSLRRAVSTSLHLGNTFLLLASLTVTGLWAMGAPRVKLRGQGWLAWLAVLALAGVLAVGATGSIAALGDTLFPARSLAEGLAQDVSPAAHAFVRLRSLHPFIAIGSGVLVLSLASFAPAARSDERVRRFARAVAIAYFVQLGLGAVNVTLLAPLWLQTLHLLSADVVWVLLVCLAASALADGEATPEAAVSASPTAETSAPRPAP